MLFESGLEDSDLPDVFEVPGSLCFGQKLKFWTNPVTAGAGIFKKNFDCCNHCELEVPRISADVCMSACLCIYMCVYISVYIRAKKLWIYGIRTAIKAMCSTISKLFVILI